MKAVKKVVKSQWSLVGTLSTFLRAVTAYYKEQGDKTSAGISLAVLDDGTFYASVGRYQRGPFHKEIVVATQKSEAHSTIESAIESVAKKWHKVVSQPTAKDAIDTLGDVLHRGDDGVW